MEFLTYEQFILVHPLAKGLTEERDLKRCYYQEYMRSIKNELSETDYKTIKYVEGYYTDEEYNKIKYQREIMRLKIRELEEKINELE